MSLLGSVAVNSFTYDEIERIAHLHAENISQGFIFSHLSVAFSFDGSLQRTERFAYHILEGDG